MILQGDCRETLKTLAAESVSSIVTDPPYEIGFMGKGWDGSGVANDPTLWAECYRVLKPGGHVLAFGAARTYHRMACAIEDAGFEIRDSIHWLYGSGFPKSHNVSKGIDRKRYHIADVYLVTAWIRETARTAGVTNAQIDEAFGFAGMAGHWTSDKSQPTVPTLDQIPLLLDTLGVAEADVPPEIRRLLFELNGRKNQPGANWALRKVVGSKNSGLDKGSDHSVNFSGSTSRNADGLIDITIPATEEAKRWDGWGTALKPAHEPIVMARKPFAGTVANNVLAHGTGALNIDASRIGTDGGTAGAGAGARVFGDGLNGARAQPVDGLGRWPANVIIGETSPAATEEWARYFYTPKAGKKERNAGLDGFPEVFAPTMRKGIGSQGDDPQTATPKQNHHPTVKPVALMRYLIRLVTPPGGLVLDPFLGSGTTAVAAILEGFNWIGCELTAEYLPIIEARTLHAARDYPAINTIQNADNSTQSQLGLFGELPL